MEKKLNKLLVAITVCIIAGCTVNYDDQSQITTKSEDIPDTEMINFKLIQMKKNTPYTEIEASKAQIYNDKNRTTLLNVKFIEYNTDNQTVLTVGKADTIVYYNDTENAKLTGNLNFVSKKDEIKIIGEVLEWNSEEKTIFSDDYSTISVIKDDGSTIEGAGFSANLKKSTYSFSNNVKGATY
ncbi:MAG: LPS export ABC transporter periplasmic protein LptC [Spirochaetaceae bacterium]